MGGRIIEKIHDVLLKKAYSIVHTKPTDHTYILRPVILSFTYEMRSSRVVRANAVVATVLGSISASSDTVESEGRQITVLNIVHKKKNPFTFKNINIFNVYSYMKMRDSLIILSCLLVNLGARYTVMCIRI